MQRPCLWTRALALHPRSHLLFKSFIERHQTRDDLDNDHSFRLFSKVSSPRSLESSGNHSNHVKIQQRVRVLAPQVPSHESDY